MIKQREILLRAGNSANPCLVLLTAVVIYVSGCASGPTARASGPQFSDYTDISDDKALVYIYRQAEKWGYDRNYALRANGEPVAILRSGGYIPYIADPGMVRFSATLNFNLAMVMIPAQGVSDTVTDQDDLINLDLERGKTYFLKFHQEVHPLHFTPKMYLVANDVGRQEIRDCKLLKTN